MSNTPKRPLSLKRDVSAESSKLEERLHKVLAQAGLGSRRALEQRIADGMVKVNGEVARTGMSVKSGDKVELDGRSFVASALTEPARVLMYNKPEGEVTTREDPEGRPTIFDTLPVLKGARWIAIGRLDINPTGLLLLTTDGELANAMMHPSREVEREYVCRVRPPEGESEVGDKLVDRLRRGVALEDGPAKFDAIERIGGNEDGSHDWFRVLLKEGRNREVRRLWESQGCQVSRLKRVRYGSVELPAPLLRGQAQELPTERVETLRREFELEQGPPPALTLQPVVGQRRAAKSTVHVGNERRAQGYVNGHNAADEGRELRRFDHVREDRGRRGQRKPHGGLTVSGEQAAKQSQKPFKQRKDKHSRALPEGNPAAFRSWYVPEGVDTGPSGHRNAGERAPKKRFGGNKPQRGPGGPHREGNFAGDQRGPRREGPRHEGHFGGEQRAPRPPRPYGHPGNAPSFPSDHAHGAGPSPYGTHGDQHRPRGPRPAGPRPAGPRPAGQRPGGGKPGGNRPFNANGPRGPRPGGGNRGPRGGGNHGGQR